MWKLHTALSDVPFEVDRLVREYSEEKVIKHLLANACYPEHGLPLLLYLARRNNVDLEGSLLANANAGGDNVHRGMVLGLIAGASNDELPDTLKKGLIAFEDLRMEIDAFAEFALSGKGI